MFGWDGKVTKGIAQKLGDAIGLLSKKSGGNTAPSRLNKVDISVNSAVVKEADLSSTLAQNSYQFNDFNVETKSGISKEQAISRKLPLFDSDIFETKLQLDISLSREIEKVDLSRIITKSNVIDIETVKSGVSELFVESIEKRIELYQLKEDIKPGKIRSLTPGKLQTKIKKDNRVIRIIPIRRHKENTRYIAREELKELWQDVAKQVKDNMQKYELIAIFDKIPVNYVENIKMEDNWESIKFSLKDDLKESPRMSKLVIIRHTENKKLSKVIVPCKEGS